MGQATPVAPAGIFVIFGASGDLTKRLLVPALLNMRRAGLLADDFAVIGVSRPDWDDDIFRQHLGEGSNEKSEGWDWLAVRLQFLQGELEDAATYRKLAQQIEAKRHLGGPAANVLFYLATPPDVFGTVAAELDRAGLLREGSGHWRRLVIEKPFGTDLQSACDLNRTLLKHLSESQIFRIDHFLGKETVQNIIVFRFGNGIFEPIWNRNHIDHVQITVAETVNVEKRGEFYDGTGALRDMIPNHLFQLLELVAMEPPTRFTTDAVRAARADVLETVHPFSAESIARDIVRGQYEAGTVAGNPVIAYRDAEGVAAQSTTETYIALKLMLESWRWKGVPFYLRTGKAMTDRRSEIVVRFKDAPTAFFRDTETNALMPNDLILHLQPGEGISLHLAVKEPGPEIEVGKAEMTFDYAERFKTRLGTGYESLLYDCMTGDRMLFKEAGEIEESWRIVEPLLQGDGHEVRMKPSPYPAGSAGPKEAEDLLARDGRAWRPLRS